MNPRERQEQWERDYLAPVAVRSSATRGRERREPDDPVRTCFQRDRDRILHSKAFRRLKHKTQVFLDPEEDHFRTRLTHTLEVAQIARTIARALRLNEDLTEAIALAHDLGHPPFGHAGEEALDSVYREFAPEAGFRHYDQSLRIVEELEVHGAGPGMNLTWEVRDGIAHHSKGRQDLATDTGVRSTTLEGKVMRIADRVAYVNHDLDDAIRAGLVRPAEVPRECAERLGETHSERIATMVIDVVETSQDLEDIRMSGPIAEATDALKEFLYERVYWHPHRGAVEMEKAQRVLRDLFRYYMEHPDKMQGRPELADLPVIERAQVVCDFVAGMTDRYALSRFVRHFLPRGMVGADSLAV